MALLFLNYCVDLHIIRVQTKLYRHLEFCMSNKKENKQDTTEKIEEGAIEVINKSDEFIRNNRKTLIGAIVLVLVVIGGIIAYKNLYIAPRQAKAEEAIFKAEQMLERDSFQIALHGNGADVMGFLEVIEKYSGTSSANLAHAYAGICLFNLEQYEEAIKHLKKFKADDEMASPALYGLIGDCYVNMGQTEEGIKYFAEAAMKADNDLLTPLYTLKAAIAYESINRIADAKSRCYVIINDYPNSPSAAEARKLLQALELH